MTEEEMYDELGEIGGQALIDSMSVTETRQSHKRVTTMTYTSGWVMSRSDKSGRDEILVTNAEGQTVWFGISDTIPFDAELWAELRAYFKRTPAVSQDDVQRIVFRRQDMANGVEPDHKELPPPVAKLKPLVAEPKQAKQAKREEKAAAPQAESQAPTAAAGKPARKPRVNPRAWDTAVALGIGAAVVMVLAKVVPPVIQAVKKGMR